MSAFMKVVKLAGKYGKKVVQWIWDNKGKVLDWLNAGMAAEWIVEQARKAVGA